jgi:hypothetical protein
MKEQLFIGIHGPMGSGKTTACNFLAMQRGLVHLNFADPLKEACMAAFGLDRDDVYTEFGKAFFNEFWGVTHRAILQFVGTELFRDKLRELLPKTASEFWVRRMEREILRHRNEIGFCFGDVRFHNEVDWIMSHPKSVIITLHRENRESGAGGIAGHPSEKSLQLDDRWQNRSWHIENEGSIHDLHANLNQILLNISY